MSLGKPRLHLGESWVVDDDDYSPHLPPNKDEHDSSAAEVTAQKRQTRTRNNKLIPSPGPQLVMPSLDVDSLDGSWTDSKMNLRNRVKNRPWERLQPTHKANRGLGNGSPEKRSRPKSRTSNIGSPGTPNSFLDLSFDHALKMLSWLYDVLRISFHILKTPISYIVAVCLLFGFGIIARNVVTNTVYTALSPICRIPGTSLLNLTFCPAYMAGSSSMPPPVEFEQLMAVQSNFEQILEESAGGVSLPIHMKKGESSIRDLRQLVRHSHLKSKDELVLEFDGFIETARIASYDLQKFNSHVGRAVDNVISTTRWTSRVLDEIQEQVVTRGSLNAFIYNNLVAPFQPTKFTEKILLDQYIKHTRSVEVEIFRLMEEAQAVLTVLNHLEDRLDIIHAISTREDGNAKAAKEEVLSSLWAKVGGHRSKLNTMDRRLNLLQQVGTYRKKAYAHVSGTILRLQAMGAGLEDLRERVGTPEFLRDRADIPLAVHIENIRRGVERLEEQRQNVRRAEDDYIRQTLGRAHKEGTMIDG
ncbi:hypothetical protein BJ875DRAFT_409417 [Amylocarpus encephaloides]|uniref:Uncharacterized protein n=1 Tax=Amylocarpus encephaloides TaxID=45428 RepID=A0A9P7YBG9_9HELO|nr:hypothetical protein BJ875DRAFT_409417 [Amylocarpus encephaloides]